MKQNKIPEFVPSPLCTNHKPLYGIISSISNRQTQEFMDIFGYGNGYVAIPPDHPYYGMDESNKDLDWIQVHGGITYGSSIIDTYGEYAPMLQEAESVFGRFTDPEEKRTVGPLIEIPKDYWLIGFDTCHGRDNRKNWDRDRLAEEVRWLHQQLDGAYYIEEHHRWGLENGLYDDEENPSTK
jgi:hypothetical protein